jgi:hypothetical protein
VIRTETSGTPEAWRTAVGLVAAAMDDQQEAFDMLREGVPEPVLAGVIADLAIIVTRLLLATAESPAAAREGLAIYALQVAEGIS